MKPQSRYIVLFILLAAIYFPTTLKAQTQRLWVGQNYECDATSALTGAGTTTDKSWSSSGGYFNLSGSGHRMIVTITQFFSGTGSVTFSWKERLTANSQWQSRSKTWYFTCIENPVSISPSEMTICIGEKGYITYHHQYENDYTYAASVSYSSTNPEVASITNTGQIIAIANGTTYVNVYSKLADPTKSPYCIVTVKEREYPTKIQLPERIQLTEGEKVELPIIVEPNNALTDFTWNSENPTIATVSQNGEVSAITPGTTIITVSSPNGVFANTIVEVLPKCSGITLPSNINIFLGYSKIINPEITPSNTKTTLTWRSSNPSIVSVTQSGTIKGIAIGSADIIVETDNGLSAAINVSVDEAPSYLQFHKMKIRTEIIDQLKSE